MNGGQRQQTTVGGVHWGHLISVLVRGVVGRSSFIWISRDTDDCRYWKGTIVQKLSVYVSSSQETYRCS